MAVATPHAPTAAAAVAARPRRPVRAPMLLLSALLAVLLYGAFAQGATGLPEESWIQLVLIACAGVACGVWLYGNGRLALRTSVAGWTGVALLALFAAWTGVTLLWSVAPDRTWIELNRGIAYALMVVLGIAVGSSMADAPRRLVTGWAIVAVPVALYAAGGKTLPGLHVDGLFDLDHAGSINRLRGSFGYWNALALFCVLALAPTLRLAADPARRIPWRLLALSGAYLLIFVTGLTYSRGGVVALAAAMTAFVALTTERLRTFTLFMLVWIASAIPVALAIRSPELSADLVPLARRTDDALVVLITLLVVLALVLAAGFALMWSERARWYSPARGRVVGRVLVGFSAVILVMGVLGAATTGVLGALADDFTRTDKAAAQTDPGRLLSTNSGNRWTWWKEALGAWSDKPVAGWGAGSFPVTHLRYRTEPLPVKQPHSVPLQWLAETGLIGAGLALGGLLALLAAALSRVRSIRPEQRGHTAALCAAPVAWLAHCFYDWDWDIPAVTLPMLLAVGVAVALPGRPTAREVLDPAPGLRALGFGLAVAALIAAALSAALPALSALRTEDVKVRTGAAKATDAQLADAAADAEVAASLNPLAIEPLLVAASIAERRGRIDLARDALVRAIERQPEDVSAWVRLARLDALIRLDREGGRRATLRALELDPINPGTLALAQLAQRGSVPPNESATATGSPLPKQIPITEPDPPGALSTGR